MTQESVTYEEIAVAYRVALKGLARVVVGALSTDAVLDLISAFRKQEENIGSARNSLAVVFTRDALEWALERRSESERYALEALNIDWTSAEAKESLLRAVQQLMIDTQWKALDIETDEG